MSYYRSWEEEEKEEEREPGFTAAVIYYWKELRGVAAFLTVVAAGVAFLVWAIVTDERAYDQEVEDNIAECERIGGDVTTFGDTQKCLLADKVIASWSID